MSRWSLRRPAPAADATGTPATQRAEELAEELRRTRQELRRTRAKLRRAQRELPHLRRFSLDVFPDLALPPRVEAVCAAVREEHLTYLSADQLRSLVACVHEVEVSGREGLVLEAGTARGGSAIAMAAAKAATRPMRVYDVFATIPPPSAKDGADVAERYQVIAEGRASGRGGETYYGYREDLLGEVTSSFARHGVPVDEHAVELVPGLFQDTLVLDEPVALAHLDGDWYESTMTCLERVAPLLVPGGRIVVDDYYQWSGCRTAVDEYFAGRPGFRLEMRARVHVVRLADGGRG